MTNSNACIHVLISDNSSHRGLFLGTIGRDDSTGGYPRVIDPTHFPQALEKHYADTVWEGLHKTDVSKYGPNRLSLGIFHELFIDKYMELTELRRCDLLDKTFQIKYEMLRFDFSQLTNIKTEILKTVCVEISFPKESIEILYSIVRA